jgi:hypothetical protein
LLLSSVVQLNFRGQCSLFVRAGSTNFMWSNTHYINRVHSGGWPVAQIAWSVVMQASPGVRPRAHVWHRASGRLAECPSAQWMSQMGRVQPTNPLKSSPETCRSSWAAMQRTFV